MECAVITALMYAGFNGFGGVTMEYTKKWGGCRYCDANDIFVVAINSSILPGEDFPD